MNCGIILGASSGIGNATYKKIKEEHPDLRIITVDREKMDTTKNDIHYILDLSDENAVSIFIGELSDKDYKFKFIVNSVGYQENVDILDLDAKQWDEMYTTTVKSVFLIEQFISKNMISNDLNNKSIVNVVSIHSNIIRDIAHYSSSKASLEMITKELAYSLSKYNIRANSVLPGSIDTPLLRKDLQNEEMLKEASEQIPLLRHGEANEVADLIIFLLSDKATYITGSSIVIDGGLSLVI